MQTSGAGRKEFTTILKECQAKNKRDVVTLRASDFVSQVFWTKFDDQITYQTSEREIFMGYGKRTTKWHHSKVRSPYSAIHGRFMER